MAWLQLLRPAIDLVSLTSVEFTPEYFLVASLLIGVFAIVAIFRPGQPLGKEGQGDTEIEPARK